MADLHLNLKGEYFDQIQAGAKSHEYRLAAKWLKRLTGKSFDRIFVKRGYPRSGDTARINERPWRGFELQTITHPHFDGEPVEVLRDTCELRTEKRSGRSLGPSRKTCVEGRESDEIVWVGVSARIA